MNFSTTPINTYIELLGSSAPTPGGGSASALSGAQGIALILMVANLTIGKPKYAQYEELNQSALTEGTKLCAELIALIDRDAQAFSKLSQAYKLPRNSDEEKSNRATAIAEATLKATQTPFEMMDVSLKALYLCKSLVGKSNDNASSDLGVSALNLSACINGAWLNVLINLSGIKNPETTEYFRTKGQEIVETAQKEADFIYNSIRTQFC